MLTIKLDKKRKLNYWEYSYKVVGEEGRFLINTGYSQREHEVALNEKIKKIINNLKYTLEIITDENRWDK